MLQLVYMSRATRQFSRSDLADLCGACERKNRTVGITGVLGVKDDQFLQIMEGPKDAVEETFLRIINDSRHQAITLLSYRSIDRREYGDWSMALHENLSVDDTMVAHVATLTINAPPTVRAAFTNMIDPFGQRSGLAL